MRPIDGDYILSEVNRMYSAMAGSMSILWLREMIANAPTIDPVKHGEWVYVDKSHIQEWQAINKCSVCGHSVCNVSYVDKVVHFNYCPHCGVKMKGV